MKPTLEIIINSTDAMRALALGFLGFVTSMVITPLYTNLAYKFEWWKKPRDTAITGEKAKMFTKLHAEKHKRHIPTMAGIVFVVAVADHHFVAPVVVEQQVKFEQVLVELAELVQQEQLLYL